MHSLDQLVIVGGFEKTGGRESLEKLQTSILDELGRREISVAGQHTVVSCLKRKGALPPNILAGELAGFLDDVLQGSRNAVVGVSYGSLIALNVLATRADILSRCCNALLLDGPLSPQVDVPKPVNGMFDEFAAQYDGRVDFARRTLQELQQVPFDERQKIVSAGSMQDTIVPGDAKILLGVIPFVNLDCIGHQLSPEKIQAATKLLIGRLCARAAA